MSGTPLFDDLAEQAVLSVMLADPKAARAATNILTTDDFHKPEHRSVFKILDTLSLDDQPIDAVVFIDTLQKNNIFEKIGGMAFLHSIYNIPGAVANASHYARLVREKALERDVYYSAVRYAEHALNGTGDEDFDRLGETRKDLALFRAGEEVPPRQTPIPFGEERLPEFPVDSLPSAVADWVVHAASSLQVPVDLPAMTALSALSAAAVGGYEVRVRGSWQEPLGLYTITTSPPGTRKSAVFTAATRALYVRQEERQKEERLDVYRQNDKRRLAEDRLEAARKRRAAAKDAAEATEAEMFYEGALAAMNEAPPHREPYRLIGDDVTPERLISLCADHGGRFALLSAEGGLLQTVVGTRYSSSGKPSYDPLLKAHAGDPISTDRKGKGVAPESVFIERPALTIGLAVQPEILRSLFSEDSARGVGLLARFLYSTPRDTVGERVIRSPEIPDEVRAAYELTLTAVSDHHALRLQIPLTAEADDVLAVFEAELEPRLREDGDLFRIRDWASKLAGATARIATLLALGDRNTFEFSAPQEVGVGAVHRAIEISRYLILHAISAFDEAIEPKDATVAKRILAWCKRTGREQFSSRDAFQALKGSSAKIQTTEDVYPAIDTLLARGLIQRLPTPHSAVGRPSSPSFQVVPL